MATTEMDDIRTYTFKDEDRAEKCMETLNQVTGVRATLYKKDKKKVAIVCPESLTGKVDEIAKTFGGEMKGGMQLSWA